MKKSMMFILFFMFFGCVNASSYTDVYISKKDIDSQFYVGDSSFTIYDNNNKVVDSWISNDKAHIVSLEVGDYKLIETPILNNKPVYYLSNYYDINVDNDRIMELTLYNKKVETPRNLGIDNNYIYFGVIFIFIGLLITLSRKFYYN